MLPKRYIIATLFIAAMLVLLLIVQGPPSKSDGSGHAEGQPVLSLDHFEVVAQYRLRDGWSPRFQGTQDPDQPLPWPFGGGFESPWEPASPYLSDRAFVLNGPQGQGEIHLWRGLEWKSFRFDHPITSARLDPVKGNRLLVTLQRGPNHFNTRLMEIPEGRVFWSTDSGPWSRFSWDGKAVLLGLPSPSHENAWLLTTLEAKGDLEEATLAPWDEKELVDAPRAWATLPEHLWEDGQDLPGHRLLVPLPTGTRFWFPQHDRLWVSGDKEWTLWGLDSGVWKRLAMGPGQLHAKPPQAMGRIVIQKDGHLEYSQSPTDEAQFETLSKQDNFWPSYDPAWFWVDDETALTAWDQRFGSLDLPKETTRERLLTSFRSDWLEASSLRRSVKGWLPNGPEVALREGLGVAWIWAGDRILLVRLPQELRIRKIRKLIKAK